MAADVDARPAAVAEVARVSLPGWRIRLNTATAPRLIERLRLRHDGVALEHHVRLRHDQLHRDLALDVDVRRASPGCRCRRRRSARSAFRRECPTATAASPTSSTMSLLPAPNAGSPSSLTSHDSGSQNDALRVLRDRLDLHVGDAGARNCSAAQRGGLRAGREAGDAAPDLAAADLRRRPALLRDRDELPSRSLRIAAPWNSGDAGFTRRQRHRPRTARPRDHRRSRSGLGRQRQ